MNFKTKKSSKWSYQWFHLKIILSNGCLCKNMQQVCWRVNDAGNDSGAVFISDTRGRHVFDHRLSLMPKIIFLLIYPDWLLSRGHDILYLLLMHCDPDQDHPLLYYKHKKTKRCLLMSFSLISVLFRPPGQGGGAAELRRRSSNWTLYVCVFVLFTVFIWLIIKPVCVTACCVCVCSLNFVLFSIIVYEIQCKIRIMTSQYSRFWCWDSFPIIMEEGRGGLWVNIVVQESGHLIYFFKYNI